jgi:hypothetical protein
MQELSNYIKRPNLQIKYIKEGEKVQAKGMHNIFNKIIAENFPNIEKEMALRKLLGHQTDITQEPVHSILSLKQLSQRTKKEHLRL